MTYSVLNRYADARKLDPYPRRGYPTFSELVGPVTVTAGGSADTKGLWTEIDAAAAGDVAMMEVWSDIRVGGSGLFRGMLMDIGVGAAASEQVIVPNVVVGEHFGGGETQQACRYWLPVHIPAGARISARIQATLASDTYGPTLMLYYGGVLGGFGGFTRATSLNLTPATSSWPNSGNLTNNAWTEVIASTTERYYALTGHFCGVNGSALASDWLDVDVGVGAAGSEVSVGSYRIRTSTTETLVAISGPTMLEVDVPVGSRLALRKNSTNALGGNIIGWGYS